MRRKKELLLFLRSRRIAFPYRSRTMNSRHGRTTGDFRLVNTSSGLQRIVVDRQLPFRHFLPSAYLGAKAPLGVCNNQIYLDNNFNVQ